jgi:hypothetical protein
MNRCELRQLAERAFDLRRDQDGFCEFGPSVNDAMSDCLKGRSDRSQGLLELRPGKYAAISPEVFGEQDLVRFADNPEFETR